MGGSQHHPQPPRNGCRRLRLETRVWDAETNRVNDTFREPEERTGTLVNTGRRIEARLRLEFWYNGRPRRRFRKNIVRLIAEIRGDRGAGLPEGHLRPGGRSRVLRLRSRRPRSRQVARDNTKSEQTVVDETSRWIHLPEQEKADQQVGYENKPDDEVGDGKRTRGSTEIHALTPHRQPERDEQDKHEHRIENDAMKEDPQRPRNCAAISDETNPCQPPTEGAVTETVTNPGNQPAAGKPRGYEYLDRDEVAPFGTDPGSLGEEEQKRHHGNDHQAIDPMRGDAPEERSRRQRTRGTGRRTVEFRKTNIGRGGRSRGERARTRTRGSARNTGRSIRGRQNVAGRRGDNRFVVGFRVRGCLLGILVTRLSRRTVRIRRSIERHRRGATVGTTVLLADLRRDRDVKGNRRRRRSSIRGRRRVVGRLFAVLGIGRRHARNIARGKLAGGMQSDDNKPTTSAAQDASTFCYGPGDAYEEDCLGNGQAHSPSGQGAKRCPKCKVERRRRHMAHRNRRQKARKLKARARRKEPPRPQTLAQALAEADSVFAAHEQKAQIEHPEMHWESVRTLTNDGRQMIFDRVDLRHSIRRS